MLAKIKTEIQAVEIYGSIKEIVLDKKSEIVPSDLENYNVTFSTLGNFYCIIKYSFNNEPNEIIKSFISWP